MKAAIAYLIAIALLGALLAGALMGAAMPRCSVGVSQGNYFVSLQAWCFYG